MSETITFERIVVFDPAWDRRHPEPSKNYGIHGVQLQMILKGPHGATDFSVFTHWHLPHVQAEIDSRTADPRWPYMSHKPQPAHVGYHSPVPKHEGQIIAREQCEYTGGVCYSDGSTLQAEDVFGILLREGSDGVWRELERRYRDRFSDEIESDNAKASDAQ